MESINEKNVLLGFHVLLYLAAVILLGRVLLNQVLMKSACGEEPSTAKIDPGFFLATAAMLLLSTLLLVYGVLLLGNWDTALPLVFQELVRIGSVLYWLFLACFIAIWGRCFG